MDTPRPLGHNFGMSDATRPPSMAQLMAAIDATWPAANKVAAGPWMLREGRGGGKRVSAATAQGDWREDDLSAAETAMRLMGQEPLFMITEDDAALDLVLDERGYHMVDPVNVRICPVEHLTDLALPRVTAFAVWEPLEIMREIWQDGDVGHPRQQVMERVSGPKTAIFGRLTDRPAGSAFAAIHDGIAMVHALHILAQHRGRGLGGWMMRAAALWAQSQGAEWLSVLCTKDNAAANGLYASLGCPILGGYHYRALSEAKTQPHEKAIA